MNDFLAGIDPIIPIMLFGSFALVGSLAIIFGLGRKIAATKEQEKSRREIAAYVAEGSMTPEDAERLLNSMSPKQDPSGRC